MPVKLFAFWDQAKLELHIERIEMQLASGAQNVSSPDAGAATFLTPSQAIRILAHLYDRWEEKTGQTIKDGQGLFIINIDVRKQF